MSDCCNEFEFTSPQGTFYMDGGIRGKDGVTFYPHVSAAGILSWTNDGGKQNPDPVNIKGEDGMSAYAAAQQAGFTGTEAQFNAYLSGIGTLTEDVDDLKSAKAPVIINTASGAIASFDDGADNMPLKGLTVNIEPVQSGTGEPSPTNVRPISGWTGCRISHSGEDTSDPAVISVSFPTEAGTVYGGTLTINADGSGGLMITHLFAQLSSIVVGDPGAVSGTGNSWWSESGSYRFNYVSASADADTQQKKIMNAIVKPASNNDIVPVLCNQFSAVSAANTYAGIQGISVATAGTIGISFGTVRPSLPELQTMLEANPISICYPLASPITYQLPAQQITTLLGTNNVWADCGDVTVEYPADTKLYIQKINAPTDDDMIADARIESGKYFLIGNTLYLSTTVIPAGDTISPGTNCTKTNLAAALNALNT